jgi:hypothetical protein
MKIGMRFVGKALGSMPAYWTIVKIRRGSRGKKVVHYYLGGGDRRNVQKMNLETFDLNFKMVEDYRQIIHLRKILKASYNTLSFSIAESQ